MTTLTTPVEQTHLRSRQGSPQSPDGFRHDDFAPNSLTLTSVQDLLELRRKGSGTPTTEGPPTPPTDQTDRSRVTQSTDFPVTRSVLVHLPRTTGVNPSFRRCRSVVSVTVTTCSEPKDPRTHTAPQHSSCSPSKTYWGWFSGSSLITPLPSFVRRKKSARRFSRVPSCRLLLQAFRLRSLCLHRNRFVPEKKIKEP